MRNQLFYALIALFLIAPLAAAQEEKPTEDPARPDSDASADASTSSQAADDAAWVDDCPPDMMCAADAGEEPSKAPADDGCAEDGCVYKGDPTPYGDSGCIECTGGPVDDSGSNCMDGQQEGEVCQDDVYYMDGPTRGPTDGSCENCRGEGGPINSHAPAEADPISAPDEGAEGDAGITSAGESAKSVPGLGLVAMALAVGAAAFIALRRVK